MVVGKVPLAPGHDFRGEGGGQLIVCLLDRPISMAEAVHHPRWREQHVTMIIHDLDEKDKGQGQYAMLIQVKVDKEK